MLSALVYLRVMSFANWFRSRAKRLRQPKYFFGALVGGAYFYFFFIRGIGGAGRGRRAAALQAVQNVPAMTPADWFPVAAAAGAVILLAILTLMWVVPTERAALGFSEAEIAFLFPAPITRRALLHFRLVSSQLRSLIGAGVMMLFTNRWSFLGGNPLTHAFGWWFIFSALNLHFSGATFTLTRLSDRGVSTWRRRTVTLLIVAAVFVVTYFRLPVGARTPVFADELSIGPFRDWIVGFASAAPLGWILWPFRAVLGPFLAVDLPAFFLALGPALVVLTLHYFWVVQTAVAFEEASIEHAQRRGARLAAWRAGERPRSAPSKPRPVPFRLRGIGRPEFAFLWKNLLSTWPYFTRRTFLLCAAGIALTSAWLNMQPAWRGFLPAIGGFAFIFSLYVLVVGPQFARQDIRSDLRRADVLKTYPLPGWQIVLGELLTPTAILTGVLWLALLAMVLTFHPSRPGLLWLTPSLRVAGALAVGLIVPALVCLQMLVPNAAALIFPGWYQGMRVRGGGPEVVGQRMIFFFAQVLTMVLAVLPAALVGAIPLAVVMLMGLKNPVTLATCAFTGAALVFIVLVAEVAGGVWLLGQRFEKLDLSAELQG